MAPKTINFHALCECRSADVHNKVCAAVILVVVCSVFTPWVCASKALCASAASTMFYKANRKIFSAKVNIRCVIMEDVA